MSNDIQKFFSQHPVFTLAEFELWRGHSGAGGEAPQQLLAHYCRTGRLVRVRRELFAAVPHSLDAASFVVDPWLVASRLAADSVLAYHTALEFHGRAHAPHTTCFYLSEHLSRPLRFQHHGYQRAPFPRSLGKGARKETGVLETERAGMAVRVTSLERTLVDLLDRPELSGGWEEIWESLESVEYFDLDLVIRYALILNNATTCSKVGFFIEQNRGRLMATDVQLRKLQTRLPRQPHYLSRSKRESGKLVSNWNLIVPKAVLERQWQEPS